MSPPALLELVLLAIAPELARAGLRIVPTAAPTVAAPVDDDGDAADLEDLDALEADDAARVTRCV